MIDIFPEDTAEEIKARILATVDIKSSYQNNRFWLKIEFGRWDECWPFTGRTTWNGYGFARHGRGGAADRLAHTMVYRHVIGKADYYAEIQHKCGNKLCCNPLHMYKINHTPRGKPVGIKGDGNRDRMLSVMDAYAAAEIGERDRWMRKYIKSQRSNYSIWIWIGLGEPEECWNWEAPEVDINGYGLWYAKNGKFVRADRRIYMETIGGLSHSTRLIHTCNNPLCCNPMHLFKENRPRKRPLTWEEIELMELIEAEQAADLAGVEL